MKNKRGEISYTSTSIAIIITVIVGAIVMAAFSWIVQGPLAGKFRSFGKEQEGNITGFTKLIFNTRGDDPFNPADERLIPDGAVYYPVDGPEMPGNGVNRFPDTPKSDDKYQEGDYIYTYNDSSGYYGTYWHVAVVDTGKTQYGKIRTVIAEKPVTDMDGTFSDCVNMEVAPEIPSSITNITAIFYGCHSLVESPVIPEGVTSMGGAFVDCYNLTTPPIIPQGITSLIETFRGCDALVTAPVIPDSVNDLYGTFRGCYALTVAPEIPTGAMNMAYTFDNCISLTTVTRIPQYVYNMTNTFYNCSNLKCTMQIDASPDSYGGCFEGTRKQIVIQGNSTKLYGLAGTAKNGNVIVGPVIYRNANGVQLDSIPDTPSTGDTAEIGDYIYTYNKGQYSIRYYGTEWSVKVIDTSKEFYRVIYPQIASKPVTHLVETFMNCSSITSSPVLPYSATSMDAAFEGSSLKYAPTIPSKVESMLSTFNRCYSLEEAPVLPDSVKDIGGIFASCKSLRTYVGNKDGDGNFGNYKLPKQVTSMVGAFRYCPIVTAPTIPSTVTNLQGTFQGCSKLTTVSAIPYGVTDLSTTFQDCVSLTSAPSIPESVLNMDSTFAYCSGLVKAPTIPSSVKNMDATFLWCSSLAGQITFNATPTKYQNCFYGTSKEIRLYATGSNEALLGKVAKTSPDGNVTVIPAGTVDFGDLW